MAKKPTKAELAAQAATVSTELKSAGIEQTAPVKKEITLADVVEATKSGSFLYTDVNFYRPNTEAGLVEINIEMQNEIGDFATRATQKAIDMRDAQNAPATDKPAAQTPVVAAEKPKFLIEKNVPIPEKIRASSNNPGAGRTAIYPFEELNVGESFFLADSPTKKAAKLLASTVAGANARYTEEIEGVTRTNRKGKVVAATKQLRMFKLFDTERTIDESLAAATGLAVGTVQKGARVFRVALPVAAAPAAEATV